MLLRPLAMRVQQLVQLLGVDSFKGLSHLTGTGGEEPFSCSCCMTGDVLLGEGWQVADTVQRAEQSVDCEQPCIPVLRQE